MSLFVQNNNILQIAYTFSIIHCIAMYSIMKNQDLKFVYIKNLK